jgi:uncharacterized small protein (DUF1192 family)
MADIVERQKLQADAGLTYLPTELTYELRMAVTGHRADEFLSWGYQWTDKPHRLVYEACGVVEAQAAEIERLRAEVEGQKNVNRLLASQVSAQRKEVERLTGERDRQYDYNAEAIFKIGVLEAEIARKDAALKHADAALAAVDAFEHDFRYIIGNSNTEIWKGARTVVRAALTPTQEPQT